MVFMLRLISGLLIVCSYAVGTTEITKLPIQNSNETILSIAEKTTAEPSSVEFNTFTPYKLKPPITDRDVENIVKPFKFRVESKENITSQKLKKSEPYTSIKIPNNAVNRTSSGRSVDIDVDKFTAPVDHNAVYTLPDTKEYTSDESFRSYHSTEEVSSFENLGLLTTPKTPYFDQKFKEAVESLNKNLEDHPESDLENSTPSKNYSSDNFIDGLEESSDDSNLEYKTFEKESNDTRMLEDGSIGKEKEIRTTINYERKYNISTSYDQNTPNVESNELHKETTKQLLNDDTVNEVKKNPSTIKHNVHVTTLKYSITKPSTEGGDAAIISNKIEGEATTTPLSTISPSPKPNNSKRGSIKFADYNKLKSSNASSISSNTSPEQTVEENQVVPVQVSPPSKEISTNHISIESSLPVTQPIQSENVTTTRTESVLSKNNTGDAVQQQSTSVYIFAQPEDIDVRTTIKNEINVQKTSVASTPRAFQPVSTTERLARETTIISQLPDVNREEISTVVDSDEITTAVTAFPRGFSLPTTTDFSTPTTEQASTGAEEKTTVNIITDYEKTTTQIFNTDSINSTTEAKTELPTEIPTTTTDNASEEQTTTVPVPTTSVPEISSYSYETTAISEEAITLPESTTVPSRETTNTEIRSSKHIKFTETTKAFTTEAYETTTSRSEDYSETTTNPSVYSSETTTSRPEDSSPTRIFSIDEASTQKKVEVTTDGTTTFPTTLNEISSSVSKEETSEFVTKVIVESTPSKTLLENETTEEKPTQESKTTPTTSFNFVHIKNIDSNHTTLTPDELKPNEIYTTPVQPSESTETLRTTTDSPSDDTTSSGLDGPSSGSGAVVAIIISCVGGICLIALACLLIVMRNRQNTFNYGQRCRPVSLDDYSVDNVSVFNSVRRKAAIRGSKMSYGNPAFEDPVCLSHPLNFPAISKFANNQEDVTAEFHDIPQIVARTSELPEGCETKNRYANVIPLPESRVFLNEIDGYPNSDYINANFVTGPKNTRKYYIACQAPMSNTVDDFWRMIWEQQSKVILMLTHLFENGIEKCFDYLPPSEVLDCHRLFGDYQVTLKKREVKEKYIISSIQLKNMVSNSWREVTHFWYMGWPEKGVPTEANSIIAFLIEARSYMKTVTLDKKITRNGDMNGTAEVNPVVVHCSPGTGRTGAVITCDISIREFEQTRQVDIPKVVYKIRRDRAGAVQTKEQYAFIYKVIDLYATKLAGGNLESI